MTAVPPPARWLTARTVQTWLTALLVLGILIDVNYLASKHYTRIDMTENQDYTLSDASKKILENIDDLVTMKVYLTEKPVPQVIKIKRRIEDTVTEFEAAARGKLRVDFIDPKDDEKEKEEAERFGVVPVPVQTIQEDRAEMVNTYLGIALLYEDKNEVLPMIIETSNLEYELISKIKKLTLYGAQKLPEVAFLGGHGEPAIGTPQIPYGDYNGIATQLRQIAHVETVNPSLPKDKHIDPERFAVLIVAAPKNLDDRALYAIDQFLMKGGSIIFLLDPMEIDMQNLRVTPRESGLDELLAHHGARVNEDLVLDVGGQRIQVRLGRTRTGQTVMGMTEYPFYLQPSNGLGTLSRAHAVTGRIDRMLFPWVSSVEPVAEALEGRTVSELIWTSKKAWTVTENPDVRPRMFEDVPKPPDEERSKKILALAVQGRFTSFFQGKEVPPLLNQATKEPIDDDPLAVPATETAEDTQIIVVGDTDFLKNELLQRNPGNAEFLQNSVDWLALNPDLVGIRAKGDVFRPLDPDLTKGEKNTFKFLNLFGVPLLVAFLGILRLLGRRAARRRYFRKLAMADTQDIDIAELRKAAKED